MHEWRCRLGKWMTSAHPLGGIDGLIIVGHAESRWMSDAILSLYTTVQTTVSRPRDDNGINDARRISVRVRQLFFFLWRINDNEL